MQHILIILFVLIAVVHSANAQTQRLSYEPATVELEGKVITEQKYGPPNYGQNPKTDQKVTVAILVLRDPIDVLATPGDAVNTQVNGVTRIQLVFTDGKTVDKQLIGKDVLVKGKLFHSHTGHHYTDVLIDVSSIQEEVCPHAMSQLEINQCAGEHYKRADNEMNVVYKRIIAGLNAADRTNLIEAQRAWLKYRSANCWAQREFKFRGGSLAPTEEGFCLRDITDARTKELIKIYETTEEGK